MPSAARPPGMPVWGGRYAAKLTLATLTAYGRVCHLCGQTGATTADHVIPRSKGGSDALDNLRPAHHACNSARGDQDLAAWWARHPIQAKPLATSARWSV
jgi:5-methylcytosine-specific restriction endonuclease McrA